MAFGYRFNNVVSIGAQVPFQFGWFTKTASGGGGESNNVSNWYGAYNASVLATLRFTIAVK